MQNTKFVYVNGYKAHVLLKDGTSHESKFIANNEDQFWLQIKRSAGIDKVISFEPAKIEKPILKGWWL